MPYIKYYLIKFNHTLFGNSFLVGNNEYNYLLKRHTYIDNERIIEIPYALSFVLKHNAEDTLEVGNVLGGYYDLKHDVLDKYEIASNVINKDVVKFNNGKKYDLIVSISTLEHVGWDEPKREKTKILKALDNLKSLLTKNGILLFTVPLGYNKYLDALLNENKIKLSEAYFLKRISTNNRWIETTWNEVKNTKYGEPFEAANAIMIGIIRR